MISVNDILRRREPSDTLAAFSHLYPRTHTMPRQHVTLSEQMLREVEDICTRNSMVKSKFIQRGVQMAIDDARKRFGEAANEPVAVPKVVALRAPLAPMVESIRRGVVTWFHMAGVCQALGIQVDALMAEIDAADDVLNYAGKDWIDAAGVAEARALSRDTAASDALGAFAQSKIDSSV